jgi:branched-chain amino acid transport system permease protein
MFFQFLINGFISGSLIALMAIGFWFIYRATSLFHIAHGAIYTAATYAFYSFYVSERIPLSFAVLLSLIISILLGLAMYFYLYRPLDLKNASAGIKFISSLAAYILIVNVIALLYGNETLVLSEGLSESISFGNAILTEIQVYQFVVFAVLFPASYFLIKATKLGRAIRAIGDNPSLFKSLGLNERLVKALVFAIGSAIAGSSSILSGLDVGIDPHMGMVPLLNAVVAVIIGGIKRLDGVVIGALLIGIVQNLVIWQFSARWESAVTFLVLITVLLYRSGGLFVVKKRVEEI